MTRVIGIDLSLTATGIAIIDTKRDDIETHTITSKPQGDDLISRDQRIGDIAGQVWNATSGFGPTGAQHPRERVADYAVIEGPAFSRSNAGTWDRAGLWWLVVTELLQITKVIIVPPTSRAKYATGKGNAGKDEVLLAVARRYLNATPANNDEADALVLAAMGVRWLGEPIEESLPKANLAAMDGVQWSAVTT